MHPYLTVQWTHNVTRCKSRLNYYFKILWLCSSQKILIIRNIVILPLILRNLFHFYMNIANIKRIVLVFIEIILNRKINQSRDLEKDNEFHFLYFLEILYKILLTMLDDIIYWPKIKQMPFRNTVFDLIGSDQFSPVVNLAYLSKYKNLN